jgi:multimeric flavodoxin WrbA
MLEADGIILASPNYINQVTASMKALFDRSSHFIHCKRLLGKYIVGVVSSGSGHDKSVLDYIKYYSNTCGAQYAGGVSCRVPLNEDKKSEARKLGKSFQAALKDKKVWPEERKSIQAGQEHFKGIMTRRKDTWTDEYHYWQDKGWL